MTPSGRHPARARLPDQKDGPKRVITGKYEDDYVKQDGRWYFQKRVYSILNEASE